MIEIIVWLSIIAIAGFLIWYGYGLLVRRPGTAKDGTEIVAVADCHLCRRPFPVDRMIHRDKIAGFVNYFCADCIEGLHEDYLAKFRDGSMRPSNALKPPDPGLN